MPTLTPGNALQVAQRQTQTMSTPTVSSTGSSGTTTNAQTGQVFQNATTGPYTLQNAQSTASYSAPQASAIPTATTTTPTVIAQPVLGTRPSTTQPRPTATTGVAPTTTKPPKDNWLDTGFYGQNGTGTNTTQKKTLGLPKQTGLQTTGVQNTTPPIQDAYTQATAEKKSQADGFMASVDPQGVMDQTMRNDLRNAIISGDEAKIQAYVSQNNLDATNTANFLNAYRTTRDVNMQQEKQQYDSDIQTQRTVQEYNTQIESQKQNIRKQQLSNDMMMSTSGRGQSQNLTDTIVGELTMQQTILENLQRSKDWALSGIASDYAYNSKIMANNYNDAMSKYTIDIQNQMKTLEDTGLAKTAEGLMAMRSKIEQTNLNKLALSQTYAQQLQFITDQMKLKSEKSKFDADQTAGYNDGYLHNANGEVIYGPTGKPYAYNPVKKLQTTISDGKGGILGIYSDGTHAPIYEGVQSTPEQLKAYATAIINAGDNGAQLLSALPDHIKTQVVDYIGKQGQVFGQQAPSQMKPEWKTWEDAEGNKQSGWLYPGQNPMSTTTGGNTNVSMAEFIKGKEGFRDKAYDDYDGHILAPGETPRGTATIGYGATSINGKPIVGGQTITQEQANELFNEQIKGYQKWANLVDPNKLSESQKTALTSLEYNAGGGVWQYPAGQKIIQQINSGDFAGAAQTLVNSGMATTNEKTGEKVQGLVNRRAEEAKLLQAKETTGDTGYSKDDYINRITAMLPAGMKDNKSEMDRVTKMAKSYMAQGMTPQEAVLKFSGYEIQDKDLTDIGMAYVDIGDNLLTLKPKNYESTVSKYINKGDFDGLNTYINGLADDKVKDRYGSDSVLSTTYKVGNDRTDTLVSLINANKDKIGAFDGNVNDFLNKFKSDPQYQKLKTILTMTQADTRKFFAGSAVTESEMDALKDFIGGKTTMTPENLVTILETIKEDRNNTFKTQRRGLLPPTGTNSNAKLSALSRILDKIAKNAPKQ